MKIDRYMPLWIGDYLADTAHLTTEEHGAYLLLIMHYWRNGPLANDLDQLKRICRLHGRNTIRTLNTVLEMFQIDGETLRHKRIDIELANAQEKSDKNRQNALKRWPKDHQGDADALRTHPQHDPNALPTECNSESESESPSPLTTKLSGQNLNQRQITKTGPLTLKKMISELTGRAAELAKVVPPIDRNGFTFLVKVVAAFDAGLISEDELIDSSNGAKLLGREPIKYFRTCLTNKVKERPEGDRDLKTILAGIKLAPPSQEKPSPPKPPDDDLPRVNFKKPTD